MAVPAIFLRQCCGVYRVVASDRNAEPGCACPNNKRERGAFISQLCTEFRNEHFLACDEIAGMSFKAYEFSVPAS